MTQVYKEGILADINLKDYLEDVCGTLKINIVIKIYKILYETGVLPVIYYLWWDLYEINLRDKRANPIHSFCKFLLTTCFTSGMALDIRGIVMNNIDVTLLFIVHQGR